MLERNKTHDREIALWNARCGINLDANLLEMYRFRECQRSREQWWDRDEKKLNQHADVKVCLGVEKIFAKESFGMSQPAAALSFTNMMNPHLFFSFSIFISFLFIARALPWGIAYRPLHVLAKSFFIFCLRRLAFYKTHDREIALWNARMRIYFDAKWRDHDWW